MSCMKKYFKTAVMLEAALCITLTIVLTLFAVVEYLKWYYKKPSGTFRG